MGCRAVYFAWVRLLHHAQTTQKQQPGKRVCHRDNTSRWNTIESLTKILHQAWGQYQPTCQHCHNRTKPRVASLSASNALDITRSSQFRPKHSPVSRFELGVGFEWNTGYEMYICCCTCEGRFSWKGRIEFMLIPTCISPVWPIDKNRYRKTVRWIDINR